jgi:hypothetical protein
LQQFEIFEKKPRTKREEQCGGDGDCVHLIHEEKMVGR